MPRIHRIPLLAVLALLMSAAFATAAHASTSQITVMQDDNALTDPVGTLNIFRSLGVTTVRSFIGWGSLAPSPNSRKRPAHFNATNPAAYRAAGWAPFDALVEQAAARGMSCYLLISGPAPLWATRPAPHGVSSRSAHDYEPSGQAYSDFVKAVGTRYSGHYTPAGASSPLPRVRFWGIWNEPNYGYQLSPQAIGGVEVAPAVYRGLVAGAWSALRATGHGHDTILFGETAPRGSTYPGLGNGTVPLRFLRALYCVDSSYRPLRGAAASARACPTTSGGSRHFRASNPGLFYASGFAAHLYTSGQSSSPGLPSPIFEPDYAGLSDLPSIIRTLDRLNRIYGSHTKFPIYNTEFGFQTNPPKGQCGCVFLSPANAAYYLNWSEYLEWSNPRVRSDAQYLLYDAPSAGHPGLSGFASGLMFANGTPKADYAAFQLPVYLPSSSTKAGRSLQVWGQVRPAPYAKLDSGSPQQVQIEFRPSSGGRWTTVDTATITNSAGYFEVPVTFPSSGSVRLQWTYPPGFLFFPANASSAVTSRTQAITIH